MHIQQCQNIEKKRPSPNSPHPSVHVQLQYHATLSALLEERDPELYDNVSLQCHATLSALQEEHFPERIQTSML